MSAVTLFGGVEKWLREVRFELPHVAAGFYSAGWGEQVFTSSPGFFRSMCNSDFLSMRFLQCFLKYHPYLMGSCPETLNTSVIMTGLSQNIFLNNREYNLLISRLLSFFANPHNTCYVNSFFEQVFIFRTMLQLIQYCIFQLFRGQREKIALVCVYSSPRNRANLVLWLK